MKSNECTVNKWGGTSQNDPFLIGQSEETGAKRERTPAGEERTWWLHTVWARTEPQTSKATEPPTTCVRLRPFTVFFLSFLAFLCQEAAGDLDDLLIPSPAQLFSLHPNDVRRDLSPAQTLSRGQFVRCSGIERWSSSWLFSSNLSRLPPGTTGSPARRADFCENWLWDTSCRGSSCPATVVEGHSSFPRLDYVAAFLLPFVDRLPLFPFGLLFSRVK